jgi:hypothetical protein
MVLTGRLSALHPQAKSNDVRPHKPSINNKKDLEMDQKETIF